MVYLDHNATTPIATPVLEAMLPFLSDRWGNPSSSYSFGASIRGEIEKARRDIAEMLGCRASEIVFTSGGTEGNNTALHSAVCSFPSKKHVVTSSVEHPSVIQYCKMLEGIGYRVTYIQTDSEGRLPLDLLAQAISSETALVSLMWANNETGVLFPMEEIISICNQRKVSLHTDASQIVGKLKVNLEDMGVDMLTLTGHKFNAPKGVGALYIKKGTPYEGLIYGGHQEASRRGGTESVASIVGLGAAAKLSTSTIKSGENVRRLRDLLESKLIGLVPNAEVNGGGAERLPNTSNISFLGIDSQALLLLLDQAGICASSGSACLALDDSPSYVIEAMKPGGAHARSCIRFSLSAKTEEAEIVRAASIIAETVSRLST